MTIHGSRYTPGFRIARLVGGPHDGHEDPVRAAPPYVHVARCPSEACRREHVFEYNGRVATDAIYELVGYDDTDRVVVYRHLDLDAELDELFADTELFVALDAMAGRSS